MVLDSYFMPNNIVYEKIEKLLWDNPDFKKDNEAFLYEF